MRPTAAKSIYIAAILCLVVTSLSSHLLQDILFSWCHCHNLGTLATNCRPFTRFSSTSAEAPELWFTLQVISLWKTLSFLSFASSLICFSVLFASSLICIWISKTERFFEHPNCAPNCLLVEDTLYLSIVTNSFQAVHDNLPVRYNCTWF